jgi:putative membrane protein
MLKPVLRFFVFWAVNVLLLWLVDMLFVNVRFDSVSALLIAGLVFGIAHALLKPVLVLLTLPITIITLGLFLLVINGLILLLVAWLVPGFHLTGFWYAVGVALVISVFSFVLNQLLTPKR